MRLIVDQFAFQHGGNLVNAVSKEEPAVEY
jgi:hypothetical protein